MKKMSNKGFMLTETLIVSTMLITVLLILYIQFKDVTRSFDESFTYNTVSSSYNLHQAKLYIEQSDYSIIAEKLKISNYVSLESCPGLYFSDVNYCKTLFEKLGIVKLIVTNENLTSFLNDNDLDNEFNKFAKTIEFEKTDGFRVIGYFKDKTYSSIKILYGDDFNFTIANACNADRLVPFTVKHIAVNDINNTTGSTLYEDTVTSRPCGSTVEVMTNAVSTNACFYPFKVTPSNILDLTLDDVNNTATIYYTKYQANVLINHLLFGTSTVLDTPTIVNSFCGNTVITEQYRKNIAGYNYDSASLTEVEVTSTGNVVNLYYKGV